MTLLYLLIAFMSGTVLGREAWRAGFIPCDVPTSLSLILIAVTPFATLLNRFAPNPRVRQALRWPQSAGFRVPQRGFSWSLGAAMLLFLLAGFARYAADPLYPCVTQSDLGFWHDEQTNITIDGHIVSYPYVDDTTQRLDVQAMTLTNTEGTHAVNGMARLVTDLDQSYEYGQPVQVHGRLTEPWSGDGGAYRDYLARRGIYSQMQFAEVSAIAGANRGNPLKRALYRLRARGEAAIHQMLPAPYAALANGMLLGIESGIPDDLMEDFRLTGTSHVIVISGSNVALIAGVLAGFFARIVGRRRAWIPVVVGIAAYALLVGGDMAVLRAALMGGLAVIGMGLGRSNSGIIALAAACLFLLIVNPLTFWDVGFQLSAIATLGLLVFTPAFARTAARMWPRWLAGPLSSPYAQSSTMQPARQPTANIVRGLIEDSLFVSLAASVAVMPLLAYTFGRISVVGILANLLIVPVQPLITIAGSIGALLGAMDLSAPAQLVTWIAWPGLFWTVLVVRWFALAPLASIEIAQYGLTSLIVTYVLMLGLRYRMQVTVWLSRMTKLGESAASKPNRTPYYGRPSVIIVVALSALLVWWAYTLLPDRLLHIYFLDVGQGEAILIQTPSGRQALIDGGDSPQMLLGELGEVMPFWDRAIDLFILTHADGDHMDAQTQAAAMLDIESAVTTQEALDATDARAWQQAMLQAEIPVTVQARGGWIDLGDGVSLWVIHPHPLGYVGPDPDNESSLVLKLVYGDFSVLLTGDAGHVSEAEWIEEKLPIHATALKVGHHGSKNSSSAAFLSTVSPEIAIIQVSEDNMYGHPHERVLSDLAGTTLLRTDIHGRIHVASNGQQMWVETEKELPTLLRR